MVDLTPSTSFASRRKPLQAAKTKPIAVSQEQLVHLSFLPAGGPTPLVITPSFADVNLADWVANNRAFINTKLLTHGGILFRGFTMRTREDFQHVLAATAIEL